jgi:hypothetical protein
LNEKNKYITIEERVPIRREIKKNKTIIIPKIIAIIIASPIPFPKLRFFLAKGLLYEIMQHIKISICNTFLQKRLIIFDLNFIVSKYIINYTIIKRRYIPGIEVMYALLNHDRVISRDGCDIFASIIKDYFLIFSDILLR